MDASFWHNRWQTNQTGWHERAVNPLLITHFPSLNVPPGGRVFVPLCGKSLDLGWLLSRGYAVAGAELSELAVTQLFAELGMEPTVSQKSESTDSFAERRSTFSWAISLTCLARSSAPSMRSMTEPHWSRYRKPCGYSTRRISRPSRRWLPNSSSAMSTTRPSCQGLRFPSPADELHRHYSDSYTLTLLARVEVPGGLKGKCPATEHIWRLDKLPG